MNLYRYQDVTLLPCYSPLQSRSDASTKCTLGSKEFRLPIIPANMKAVMDLKTAEFLSNNFYFYVMHRFGINNYDFVKGANDGDWQTISISVGVKDEDIAALEKIKKDNLALDYITVDIAHGHSINMKNTLAGIRDIFDNDVFIIAGNVATPSGVRDLYRWGADCVKVGIGQGHACTTKDKTGFTVPMFSNVLECSRCHFEQQGLQERGRIPIIADGGVQCNGDIAKALAAGAKMVMAGSLFSRCVDSPAPTVVMQDGSVAKKYFGSASTMNKGHTKNVEGTVRLVKSNGMKYSEKLEEIEQDLQSSISYAGGCDLSSLNSVEYRAFK